MDATKDQVWIHSDADKGHYFVSTKSNQLDKAFIQWAFESEHMGWAKRLPDELLDRMLDHSLTYGLYRYVGTNLQGEEFTEQRAKSLSKSDLRQIGLARVITDYVTFAWVTDVFVLPEFQGSGLGTWMVQCLGRFLTEIEQEGGLRRSMLMTSNPKSGPRWYNKHLGMMEHEQGKNNLIVMTSSDELRT